MSTDFRALCAELVAALNNAIRVIYHEDGTLHISTAEPALERARAALAEPDGPAMSDDREPASVTTEPSDAELRELWMDCWDTSEECGAFQFARAVLARWGTPNLAETRSSLEPIPVTERPSDVGDCDAEGFSWWFSPAAAAQRELTRAKLLAIAAKLERRMLFAPTGSPPPPSGESD